MSNHDEPPDREQQLDEILAYYLQATERGERPSLEDLRARYPALKTDPELEKALKEAIKDIKFGERVFPPESCLPDFGSDYEVLEEIGRGGMGIVYKAYQKSLNKVVAIKTIIGGPLVTESDVERIRKEAQEAASLLHPNIVTVHQVAEHDGNPFIVMEYIEGGTLVDLIQEGPLSSFAAVDYLNVVAEAIHYAHQRGILHCDLKPANILLDEEGTPYVTDFGLAKRLGEDARYLPASAVGGTAGYMAPEQVASDELTTATDVYGLGAVLYTLLTGRPPFRAKTLSET